MLLLWMIVTNSRNYQMYSYYSRHKLGKHRGLEDIVVLPRFYIFPDQQYPTIVPLLLFIHFLKVLFLLRIHSQL